MYAVVVPRHLQLRCVPSCRRAVVPIVLFEVSVLVPTSGVLEALNNTVTIDIRQCLTPMFRAKTSGFFMWSGRVKDNTM